MSERNDRLPDVLIKSLKPDQVSMLDQWLGGNSQPEIFEKYRVAIQMYIANLNEHSTNSLIKSNETIADSNSRYTFGMVILTAALFFVGLVQMFIQAMQIFGESPLGFVVFCSAIVLLFFVSLKGLAKELSVSVNL